MLILKAYIYWILYYGLEAYRWIVLVYCIAGFFVRNRYAGWYVFLEELVEPALRFIRRITMGKLTIDRFDLSPILLFFGMHLLQIGLYYIFNL